MSNKVLVSIIIAIIVIGGAAAGYYYWQQTKPLKITPQDQTNNPTPMPTPVSQDNASTTPTPSPVAKNGQCVRDFDAAKLQTAKVDIANRQVTLDVKDFGKIVLDLYDKDAPKAVESFLRLVNSGYYDCLTFHRVAKGFVIQGGDPNGNGTGG